ncbi:MULTISPECIES: hypothetical protein [unclassified Calothrix]|nr:hypothetical protein [Calothrix sp. FACHB-1219]
MIEKINVLGVRRDSSEKSGTGIGNQTDGAFAIASLKKCAVE